MGCYVCIEESHVGMVESFGKFSRVAYPGMTCMNCITEKVSGCMSLRVEQYDLDVETRSKDNVFVNIKMAVQVKIAESADQFPKSKLKKKKMLRTKKRMMLNLLWNQMSLIYNSPVKKADDQILYNAYYKLSKPVDQIKTYLKEYFRFHGMEYTLDEMFAAKNEMTHELQNLLNQKMNPYGYIIMNVLVVDIDPDPKVKQAMNDIIACEKEKRAQQSRAEADKITKILGAEAESRTRELAGEGIANARKAIVLGLQTSVENFQQAIPGTDPNDILMTVMMTQYLDTLKEAAANGNNTFILPSSPAQVATMEDQMRMALLSSRSRNSKDKEKDE